MTVSPVKETIAANTVGDRNTVDSQPISQAEEFAIESLARETHMDVEVIRSVYEHEHRRLAAQAKITTYLPVITARLVRISLQRTTTAVQLQ